MDSRRRPGVNDRNNNAAEKAERYKALLSVIKSIILKSKRWAFEYTPYIDEVEAMRLEVEPTLPFVPGKLHIRIVYTAIKAVKTLFYASACIS